MAPPKKNAQKKFNNSNSLYEHLKEEAKDEVTNQAIDTFSNATGINKETILSYILNQDSVTYLLGGVSFLAAPLGSSSSSTSS